MLYFRDWAEAKPITCFQLVMGHYNCGFVEALNHIYKDMVIKRDRGKSLFLNKPKPLNKTNIKHPKSSLQVSISKWTKNQAGYLKQYYIGEEQIKKFQIFPIDALWINGKINWTYSNSDPAIGYYFGRDEEGNQKWKIYFYRRKKYRFLGNTNRINGWIQIPEKGELLVITKSMKDVACLDIFNVPAIAMQNETTIPYDYIIEELNERYISLISFYDFDRTGIINANKLKSLYNIPYLFLTNGRFGTEDMGAKDFSDYLKLKGKPYGKEFVDKNLFIFPEAKELDTVQRLENK